MSAGLQQCGRRERAEQSYRLSGRRQNEKQLTRLFLGLMGQKQKQPSHVACFDEHLDCNMGRESKMGEEPMALPGSGFDHVPVGRTTSDHLGL
jgi:hypothetical protein